MNTMADALIRANMVHKDLHPDVRLQRNIARKWRKALNWAVKQGRDVMARIVLELEDDVQSIPVYLDFDAVVRTCHVLLGDNMTWVANIPEIKGKANQSVRSQILADLEKAEKKCRRASNVVKSDNKKTPHK